LISILEVCEFVFASLTSSRPFIMADIATRAYQTLTPADLAPAEYPRKFQTAIFTLIRHELSAFDPKTNAPLIAAADFQNLNAMLLNPVQTLYANDTNEALHWHLGPPAQGVTVLQWPGKPSYPMFNIYDALAVVHTILAKRYGFIPLGTRRDKRTDRPVPFAQIPRKDQQVLGPEPLIQILESVRICCNAFALPYGKKSARAQGLPAMVGYSVPSSPNATMPYPNFGVVAGGNPDEKRDIINARKARFSTAVQGVPQAAPWVCGNCAEQAYWPLPSDEQTAYDGLTVMMFKRFSAPPATAGEAAISCDNCKAMTVQLAVEGFIIRDLGALGRPPKNPGPALMGRQDPVTGEFGPSEPLRIGGNQATPGVAPAAG